MNGPKGRIGSNDSDQPSNLGESVRDFVDFDINPQYSSISLTEKIPPTLALFPLGIQDKSVLTTTVL